MGLRKAINDKCKDCTYDELDSGTWRQQVSACDITGCPLHPYRPRSSSDPEVIAQKRANKLSGKYANRFGHSAQEPAILRPDEDAK
jgi:hypothetical protein